MSWNRFTLGEISTNIQTGPFGSQLHQSDYSEMGIPVVMPKDLIDGHISEETIARVNEEHVERLSRHKIDNGDILYSRRGDVGRCAYASEYEKGWLCGTGCLRVTVNPVIANPKFVFYQLQKNETVGWVVNHAVGSTMLNLNTSVLSEVPVELPSLSIQNHIVEILSAYEDLIYNNKKQIKLLEEAAQRLYKEWFVKGKRISKEAAAHLRKYHFVEGRVTNLYLAAPLAKTPEEKTQYIKNKAFDDQYYRDLIIKYLQQYGKAKKSDIRELLWDKLPDTLSNSQKNSRINTILTYMRRNNIIKTDSDNHQLSNWILV